MDGQVIYGETKFPYRLAKFLGHRHSQKAGIYNSVSVLKTIELYRLLKKHKGQRNIVHFLNGERDVRHLGFFKKRFPNTFFCATFHRPPEWLENNIPNASALKMLDGVIAVGTNQVEFLKEWLNLEKVQYIPHGVDTEFFKPSTIIKKQNTLLFVGQHLRDFETLNRTIPRLSEEMKNLEVNVVIHPAHVNRVAKHVCVNIFTQVSDKTLRSLYQESTALFLPMLNSTACNSILEAMACGLPIITSDVGGNKGYLEGTKSLLIKNEDEKNLVKKVIELLNDDKRLEEMTVLSRKTALNLGWHNIAGKVNDFDNSI